MTMHINAVRFVLKNTMEDQFLAEFHQMDTAGLSQSYLMNTRIRNFTAIAMFDAA